MEVTPDRTEMRERPGARPWDDEVELSELFGIVMRYRWTVLAVLLLGASTAAAYSLTNRPVYQSDVLMHVRSPETKLGMLADLDLISGVEPSVQTGTDIIRSRAILGAVVDELDLTVNVTPIHLPLIGQAMARRHEGDQLAAPLPGFGDYAWGGERLRVSELSLPATADRHLFRLEVVSPERYRLFDQTRDRLLLEGRVGEPAEAAGLRIVVEEMRGRPGAGFLIEAVPRADAIDQLRQRLSVNSEGSRGRSEGNILKLVYRDNDAERAANVANRVAAHYVGYNIRRSAEEAEKTLGYIEQQLAELSRDPTFDNKLYFMLMTRAQELKVMKAGIVGNVHIIDRAVPSRNPVGPSPVMIGGIGAVLGLLTGILMAFLRHALDRTVHVPEDLETRAGLEVYGIVPESRSEKRRTGTAARLLHRTAPPHLLAEHTANDLAVEGLRYLRTALQFNIGTRPDAQVVTITGSTAGVGKTFVSANVAYLLAESGKRVALVDADMHRGRAYSYFGPERGPGLAEYLAGEVEADDIVAPSRVAGLTVITPGRAGQNASNHIDNGRMEALLQQLRKDHDLVIVDTPPVLALADGAVIARASDAVLMVVRAGQTRYSEITASWRRLMQAGIKADGVILNAMPYAERGYGYGYAYVPEYLLERSRNQ